uniref:RWP-RK domain-containing protein n=1 Tax=Pyramimonas obovata TaxID=1411642 RepID=A0A7S0N8A0_9CHLO|mmetsp:Transcript_21528/g.47225  ORF Transcript_21528/g.47225 Transcript_21528/m.47225 type:complete len:285 (+) Transcript_21528:109-963(+)
MEGNASSSCCGIFGCQVVHRSLFSDGLSDSLLEVHHSPAHGTHGLRRNMHRLLMVANDRTEVKWFGSSLEAFQYLRQHEEEHLSRGFTTVFCKSLGDNNVLNAQNMQNGYQPPLSIKAEGASPLWSGQEVAVPEQPTRGELNDCPTARPTFDGSSQLCEREDNGKEASADHQPSKEADSHTNDNTMLTSPDTPSTSPRGGKMTKGETDIQRVAQFFHLPINDAAKELGMCLTVLKKICRRNGLKRWPHRKLKSIDKILDSLNSTLLNDDDVEDITASDVGTRIR